MVGHFCKARSTSANWATVLAAWAAGGGTWLACVAAMAVWS